MQELGVGIVNMQAADIDRLTYPKWTGANDWVVVERLDQDEHGYDMYRLEREGDNPIVVPANRLVFMARMLGQMT